jgi:hypothetical protein
LIGEPKPRKSFDSYAHPETKERAWKGIEAIKEGEESTIRDSRIVQPTEATVKESLSVQIELPPMPLPSKTCAQCGEDFAPYKNGCMEPNICRKCINEKISKGMTKKHEKQPSEKPMEKKKMEEAESLILTFSGKRDSRVYEAICASAENDRRTPENQVLHFLEMAFNGFGADVTFALEQTINREE